MIIYLSIGDSEQMEKGLEFLLIRLACHWLIGCPFRSSTAESIFDKTNESSKH